ncbi:MAG: bifunctional (p)ppGpp synthetase/guanosine-3',5'-bis(diphosphate) 3'-pyrophosphohydrolase [Deltaproteobacteria bacterium]|nr:bifunctional (p)ppGpp synthetase/guanosine-3',5'-bis(diphosphate) 3'-pyrophosphohydrolase [Deltaproteobacteria bacterium]
MAYPTLVHRALDFAAIAHRTQLRKSPEAQIPYVSHCAGVALLLARHGLADEVVAAGALHDTLEDTEVTAQELEKAFGARVLFLVESCSEPDKSLPWEERKARYIAHLRVADPDARAISAADKLHNMQSMINAKRAGFDPFAQMKRGRDLQLDRFHRFVEALADGWSHPLVDEVRATLRELESVI